MVFGFSKAKHSPIAVDFGADSLKLLQVSPGDPPSIVAAATEALPEGARQSPTARYAFFADALKRLVKNTPFSGHRAALSIPAYQTLITHLQIPNSDAAELETLVGVHLRQRLNVNPDRMVMRHVVVPGVHSGKQEVICMAASRESVMHYVEIAQQAKLDVVSMQAEPQSIIKAFEHLFRAADARDRTVCFVDIGGSTTKVAITHGGRLVFAKAIHVAGDHLTRHYGDAKSLSYMEAREARWSGEAAASTAASESPAIATLTQTKHAAAPRVTQQPQDEATEDSLVCMIEELQMCVRYHTSLFPERQIEKLIFLGGESHHTDICQRIARTLRIGAQLGDPMARLTKVTAVKATQGVDFAQSQPGWAVPLGLCLAEQTV
jgi:type IV pilus assembly protein PilM